MVNTHLKIDRCKWSSWRQWGAVFLKRGWREPVWVSSGEMTGYQANHLSPLIFILSPYFDCLARLKIQHSASEQITVSLELSVLATPDQAAFPSHLEWCAECLLASSFFPQLAATSRSGDFYRPKSDPIISFTFSNRDSLLFWWDKRTSPWPLQPPSSARLILSNPGLMLELGSGVSIFPICWALLWAQRRIPEKIWHHLTHFRAYAAFSLRAGYQPLWTSTPFYAFLSSASPRLPPTCSPCLYLE